MSNDEASKLREILQRSRTGSPDAGKYCNSVNIINSSWEFMFVFAQLVPVGVDEDGDFQIEAVPIERLLMSPQHAKAFLRVLTENLAKWEATYGEIQTTETEL